MELASPPHEFQDRRAHRAQVARVRGAQLAETAGIDVQTIHGDFQFRALAGHERVEPLGRLRNRRG